MADPTSLRHAYAVLIGSRARAQAGYRASFALELLANVGLGLVEFAEVFVVFHNVRLFGGLDFTAAALVFGLSNLGFALGDLAVGNMDQVPQLIRSGTFDVLLLRPLPLLAQLATAELVLRRLGRAAFGAGVLAVALPLADVDWTAGRVALAVATPLAGAVLFGALFVTAGAVQFWLIDGAEFTSAFTYGSEYAGQFSAAVMPLPVRVLFTFVVPATFTGYLPALALLGLPGPAWLPAWLGWWVPLAALLAWLGALGAWRLGVRHYEGAGG